MSGIFPQVCNLTAGHFYQFRVFAANVAGVGKPSEASEAFLCEKWTMPEPGRERMSLSDLFIQKVYLVCLILLQKLLSIAEQHNLT